MKFRGKMTEVLCIKQFSNIIGALAKLAKDCKLRITPDKIFFTVSDGSTLERPLAYCIIEQAHFFNEYTVVGVSNTHNMICLIFSPDLLARATANLRTSASTKSVKMKLTNKMSPCLTFEIESVSIDFPNFRILRTIAERMRNINLYLEVGANSLGTLVIETRTDIVRLRTQFNDLNINSTANALPDPEKIRSVRVDVRKFVQVLASEQLHPNKMQCDIADGRLLHLLVMHEDVTLHYFLSHYDS
ncbi:checkpoint protein HUS1-like isoform X2 [Schistocerca cancellata]|uniref:checkpoint protein HUS1-like isoform X2 n=1 Tax=Schistocerca cancellata TaxID=274614 RepID=UPI00211766A6|nr:checkpoint protein HUS1-like isoform X2 [Schistocerca cancellata]